MFRPFSPFQPFQPFTGLVKSGPAAILESIAVTPGAPEIDDGATLQFTATGTYDDASTANITALVTWASDDEAVATIDAAGIATGIGPGQATISATLGAISGDTTLDVSAVPLWSRDLTALAVGADATFGRTSAGYHQQPTGSWVSIASGAPRFYGANWTGAAWDTTGATGPYGLLMEPTDTNRIYASSAASGWGAYLATYAESLTDSPYGTKYRNFVANTANDIHVVYCPNASTLIMPNDEYWYSASWKANGYNYCDIGLHDGVNSNDTRTSIVSVNLTTGAVADAFHKARVDFAATSQIDGGFRVQIHFPTFTVTGRSVFIAASGAAVDPISPWLGDGSSGGLFAGHMLTTYSHGSFIPTTSAAVARAIDTLSYTGVPADNETRIVKRLVSDPATEVIVDIDDWDGAVPAPTVPQFIQRIDVYAPGGRPV